jgi:hypothetical protein
MVIQAHPQASRAPAPPRPELRLIESGRPLAQLHLFTFVVGNALFWTLWGAVSISTERWYWWPVVPFAGWALVLMLHLRHALHGASR